MKISEPKFLLKEPNGDKKTLISLVVRFNSLRIVYSTGETIHPQNWDDQSQRAKITKKHPENADINTWLNKIINEVGNVFRELKINGIEPTVELVKSELSKKLNDQPSEKTTTLFAFIEQYIDRSDAIKKSGTVKTYRTTFNVLKGYCERMGSKIDFKDINMTFYSYFTQYLVRDKIYAQNTIAKHIRTLKIFLNAATEEGINICLDFQNKRFKCPTEQVTKIYLTEKEIDTLYNLALSNNEKLDRVRDLFIIGCFTGLRFSDFNELKPTNIEGDVIKVKTKKTGETVILPFSKRLREIYIKYNDGFPKPISNQKLNDYLKDLGQLAELNDTIVISKMKQGVRVDEVFKKYELLTTHVARRSFATNAYLAGLSTIEIMKFTGHQSEKIFMGYIRFSKEENAHKLKSHTFFNR